MSPRPLPRWKRGVRDRIYDHVYSSPDGEVGGVLVGDIPDHGPVRISAAIPALRAEGERASVTFTHDAWAEVHGIIEKKHKGKRIVGWYHSHPGFGIFLSEHDLFIQRNFFSDPAQVAYVVDPHASTEGLFAWVDGEIEEVVSEKTPRKPVTRPLPAKAGVARGDKPPPSKTAVIVVGVVAAFVAGGLVWFTTFRGGDVGARPAVTVTQTGTTTSPTPSSTTAADPTATETHNKVITPTPASGENGKFGSKTVATTRPPPVARTTTPPSNGVQPPAPPAGP